MKKAWDEMTDRLVLSLFFLIVSFLAMASPKKAIHIVEDYLS